MKKLFFTVVTFCSIQSLLAQSPKVFVSDSSKPIIQQQLLFQNRIIGKTEKGTVYALPQDNMPVLVPDSSFTSNMPNSLKTETPGLSMPNPYYPGKPEVKSHPPTTDSTRKTTPFKMYHYKKPATKQ
ncbi:hypothetical protein [Lacibacter sp.]|uniref:hypothetical protein n=1 Tax=Lacibacter sp. TaxID=1915409 RepID=UPI002B4B783C|nr:hypothetical protein [Lacibacter sp.]HLP35300.1 hypothetical protein [Lacibacter sp.]